METTGTNFIISETSFHSSDGTYLSLSFGIEGPQHGDLDLSDVSRICHNNRKAMAMSSLHYLDKV